MRKLIYELTASDVGHTHKVIDSSDIGPSRVVWFDTILGYCRACDIGKRIYEIGSNQLGGTIYEIESNYEQQTRMKREQARS